MDKVLADKTGVIYECGDCGNTYFSKRTLEQADRLFLEECPDIGFKDTVLICDDCEAERNLCK